MLLRFTGEADHDARAQGRFGEDVADAVKHFAGVARKGAAHAREHVRVRMLHGHVEIGHERLARRAQVFEHFRRHPGGIEVEQPQPFKAGQGEKLVEQHAQVRLAVEIAAPCGHVLRHQHQFLDALIEQAARFVDDEFLGVRTVTAPDARDSAERTGVAATVADLEPCVGGARAEQAARRGRLGQAELAGDHRGPLLKAAVVQPEIDLREFRGQLALMIAPHQTARHGQQRAFGQVFDVRNGLRDGPHRFLGGGLDEGAGIDENQIGVFRRVHRDKLHAERPEKALGVDPVLGTAEACGIAAKRMGHGLPHIVMPPHAQRRAASRFLVLIMDLWPPSGAGQRTLPLADGPARPPAAKGAFRKRRSSSRPPGAALPQTGNVLTGWVIGGKLYGV